MTNTSATRERTTGRRAFFGSVAGLFALPLAQAAPDTAAASAQRDARPRPGDDGRLFNPGAAGRPRTPTQPGDASEEIKLIEQKLACHCGCTLDIFTCRTTDFTCTTSPRLHGEVVALHEAGSTEREILDAFVSKYGEQALMAPEPTGFNLAGYLVPGLVILFLGAVLAWVVSRRLRFAVPVAPAGQSVAGESMIVTAEAEERLRQALAEVED